MHACMVGRKKDKHLQRNECIYEYVHNYTYEYIHTDVGTRKEYKAACCVHNAATVSLCVYVCIMYACMFAHVFLCIMSLHVCM